MTKTLVVLPAYNEAGSIGAVLRSVRANVPEADILVIDDGSSDDTAAEARTQGATFVAIHACNLGIGGAVQTGLRFALQHGYDHLARLDSDGQHPPAEIPALLAAIRDNDLDLVVGSRFLSKEGFQSSALRRVGIRFLSLLGLMLTGTRLRDVTSGFRVYSRDAVRTLVVDYPTDYPEPDELVLLLARGLKVAEHSVEMQGRDAGQSSISGLHSIFYVAKVSLSMCMTRLRVMMD